MICLKPSRMAESLLPPSYLAPTVPADATPADCIRLWVDLMNTCEQLLLAGLRRQIGTDGDLAVAYRQWCGERTEEHDRMMERLVSELRRRGDGNR